MFPPKYANSCPLMTGQVMALPPKYTVSCPPMAGLAILLRAKRLGGGVAVVGSPGAGGGGFWPRETRPKMEPTLADHEKGPRVRFCRALVESRSGNVVVQAGSGRGGWR